MSVKITPQEEIEVKNELAYTLLCEYLKINTERQDHFISSIKNLLLNTQAPILRDEKLKDLLEHLLEESNKTREIQQKFFSNINRLLNPGKF